MVTTRRSRSVTSDDSVAVAPSANLNKTPSSKRTKDKLKTTDTGKISKSKSSKRSRSKRRGSKEKSATSNDEPASPSASQTSSSGRSDESVKEKMKKTTIDTAKIDSDVSHTPSPEPSDDAIMTSTPDVKTTPSVSRKRSIDELDTEIEHATEKTENRKRPEDSPPPRKRSRERALPADTIIGSTQEMIDESGSLSPGRRSILKRSHDQIAANLRDKENSEKKSPVNGTSLADKKTISRPSSRGATGEPPEKKAKDTPSPSQSPARLETDNIPISVTMSSTIETVNGKDKEEVIETTTKAIKLPAGSGFGNTSAASPFASLGSDKPSIFQSSSTSQDSNSAFASSGFAKLASSTASPFGLAAAAPSASPFGALGAVPAPSPFGTLGATASASPFGALGGGGSIFGASPFATGSSGLPNVFASSAPKPAVPIVPLGAKPAKPFGAPDTDDEAEEGDDDEDGNDEGESVAADEHKNGQCSGTKGSKRGLTNIAGIGEENEDTIHQVRAKLFQFENAGWRERGTGVLKLLVEKEKEDDDDADGESSKKSRKARLVMRQEGVGRVILNAVLFSAMDIEQVDRIARFWITATGDDGQIKTIRNTVRVGSSEAASKLIEQMNEYMPKK